MTPPRTTASATRLPSSRWWVFLWLTLSAHFALVYTLNTRPMLDLDRFTRGTERIPFQYRALTAWLFELAGAVQMPATLERHLPPVLHTPAEFMLLGITFVSMLAAIYSTARTLEVLKTPAARWWALAVVPMAWCHYLLAFGHPCCTPLQLPYDLPSLAFFAVGLWTIAARRPWLLYPLVALATTNRESSIFLVAIYALFELGLARQTKARLPRAAALHTTGLVLVFAGTLTVMHRLFPHATHEFTTLGPFENHLVDNLHFLLLPFYWLSFLSLFGFTWPWVYVNWRRVPHAGIRYALAVFPLMFAAMYVVAELSEIRVFAELIPLLAVAVALLFAQPVEVPGRPSP